MAKDVLHLVVILCSSIAGLLLVLSGDSGAGFTALCFASLQSIRYEIEHKS